MFQDAGLRRLALGRQPANIVLLIRPIDADEGGKWRACGHKQLLSSEENRAEDTLALALRNPYSETLVVVI
jgi:hypothetical protein